MNLVNETGKISGVLTSNGVYLFTIQVTDFFTMPCSTQREYILMVEPLEKIYFPIVWKG